MIMASRLYAYRIEASNLRIDQRNFKLANEFIGIRIRVMLKQMTGNSNITINYGQHIQVYKAEASNLYIQPLKFNLATA